MKRFRSHFSVHFCHSFFSCAIVFQSFSPSIIFMFFSQQMHKSAPRGLPSTFLRTRALNKRSALPYWVWKCIEGTVRGFALLGSQVFIYKHREVEGVWKRCRERKRIRRGLLNIWHKDLRMFRKRERGGARLAFPMLAFCNEQRSQRAGPCRVTQKYNHRAGPRVSSHTNTLDRPFQHATVILSNWQGPLSAAVPNEGSAFWHTQHLQQSKCQTLAILLYCGR